MNPSVCFRALIVLGALTCVAAIFGCIPLRAQAQSAQTRVAHDVVVILRDQLASTPPQRRAMQGRSAALASAQDAVFARLPANATRTKMQFRTINAFATTVTQAEADQLAQDPDIQPDPARIGKTVSGDVFIDTFNFVQFNGDELVRIPYRYRVVQ